MPIDPFTAGLLTAAGKKFVDFVSREQTCETCNRLVWDIYRTGCCSVLICKRCLDQLDFAQTNCCERALCRRCVDRWMVDRSQCGYCDRRFGITNGRNSMIGGQRGGGDPRIRRLLEELDYRYEVDGDGDFKLTMNLGDGRSQAGFIISKTSSFGGLEIRELYSFGYILDEPPSQKIANFLLRDNGQVKMGAWRISGGQDGGRCGLMFAAHIGADSDAKTLNTVLEFVLRKADNFEKEVFETDNF